MHTMVSRAMAGVAAAAALLVSSPAGAEAPAPGALAVTVPTFGNTTCPIMGKPSSKALFTDTEYGRIYICCMPCVAKILEDPARAHKAAYPAVKKVGNTVCPVTDAPLGPDAVTVVLQGHEIGVCGPACVKPAQRNAQIVLAKATNPRVRDVGNLTCPVTGKPVVDNAFCLIGDDLVRLSSPKAVDEVRKAPAATLAAAKAIAAKQRAAKAPSPR